MIRRVLLVGLSVTSASLALSALALAPGQASGSTGDRGGPGTWTKISTGTVGITGEASLYRTSNKVLHVVYPKEVSGADQIGHTSISLTGTTTLQNDVLPSPWMDREPSPIVIGGPGGGLRVVFGGQQSLSGYWSAGRMYTATAPSAGHPWALPAEAVGNSTAAYGSAGSAATNLADGTPVAGFPLNDTITWHVGTADATPDQSFSVGSGTVSDLAMVRTSTNAVYIGWYAAGGTATTTGTFVRQILPSLGPIRKAPGSSVGTTAQDTGRVALAARGTGVVVAYCTGAPCNAVRLWKVGATTATAVPSSRYADHIALAPSISGRLWVTWSNNIPTIQATRTSKAGLATGPIRPVGMPHGAGAVYSVAIEGSTGRGDVVINVGNAFWHTQVIAQLRLAASPTSWPHGRAKVVTFTVTDAGDKVGGARVAVGSRHCLTNSQGKCHLTFPASVTAGALVAKATKASYVPATKGLRVAH